VSSQLDTLLRLRDQEVEKRERQLTYVQQQLAQLEAQSQALEEYALSYQQQLSAIGAMSMQQRQLIAAYLQQVQSAILGQSEKIALAKQQVDIARQHWSKARTDREAIAKLMEKRAKDAQRIADKQEQKLQDELVQAKFSNKS
jgi:flagellar FliJ protein